MGVLVIKEISEITKLTDREDMLNRLVSKNFTEAEQKDLVPILKGMLIDEFIHVIAIKRVEDTKHELIHGL